MNKDAAVEEDKPADKPTETKPATAAAEPKKDDAKKPAAKGTEKKDDGKKPAAKTADKKAAPAKAAPKAKKEEEEIPMDNAAIKAYSSVIADAAEDSEP